MIPTWTLIIITSWMAPCGAHMFEQNCNQVLHTVSSVPGFATREDCQHVLEIVKDGVSGIATCVRTAHTT